MSRWWSLGLFVFWWLSVMLAYIVGYVRSSEARRLTIEGTHRLAYEKGRLDGMNETMKMVNEELARR